MCHLFRPPAGTSLVPSRLNYDMAVTIVTNLAFGGSRAPSAAHAVPLDPRTGRSDHVPYGVGEL